MALFQAGVGDVAVLYEALFLKTDGRMGPRDVDQLEIWEVALLLQAGAPAKTATTVSDDRFRLIRERMAHAKGLGPPAQARPLSAADLAALE